MNITIYGGGNIGSQFAVHCAEKGHSVIIYTTKPNLFSKDLKIIDETNTIIHKGSINCATSSPDIAFSNVDLIFITVPAFMMKEASSTIEPFFKKGLLICLVPGTGGGECAFKNAIDKGCIIFGLQRVPSVARLKEYGKSVCATGYRDSLHLAAIPKNETKKCSTLMQEIFEMPVVELPNYLCVTMTPSNPILHTSRLKSLFDDYHKGKIYNYIPLFYEEWSIKSSELLIKNDEEVQNICKALPQFDLTNVKSLKVHYESNNAEELTNKMRSIKSLQGLKTPSVEVESGVIPDLSSRYFTADFPFGLEILVQIGKLAKVNIPSLIETLNWYWNIAGKNEKFNYSDYGIYNLEDFLNFYNL